MAFPTRNNKQHSNVWRYYYCVNEKMYFIPNRMENFPYLFIKKVQKKKKEKKW